MCIRDSSDKLDDRALMHIRNEAWKAYRDDCDWVIVCDVDEFLYHPDLHARLRAFKAEGVTLPMVEGFEMLSKDHPVHRPGHYIWQDIQTGTPNPRYYNKNLIFDPAIDINYTLGCHGCQPTGPVRRSDAFEFKNLHYRNLSYAHMVEKSARSAARLSDWNLATNAGFHYRLNAGMSREDYNRLFVPAANVLSPWPRPAARRASFELLQAHVLGLEHAPRLCELGVSTGLGRRGDDVATEWLGWLAHTYGGALVSIASDGRALRHAAHELGARRRVPQRWQRLATDQPGAALAAAGPAGDGLDAVFCHDDDFCGDAADRRACMRQALNDLVEIEPHLEEGALVVLDGVRGSVGGPAVRPGADGKFDLLLPYLIGRGYTVRLAGYSTVLAVPRAA